MKLRKFVLGIIQTNSYILCNSKDECILIDCGGDPKTILEYLEGKKLKYILLTHGHFDHITGLNKIKEKTKAKIGVHKKDELMLSHPMNIGFGKIEKVKADFNFNEGDVVSIDEIKLKVLETPGHTPGGVCFYFKEEGILFSGDTLFKQGIGRTDLPLASYSEMEKSLERLSKFPKDTKVYPGHGEETTIGDEFT